jgi:hypothetical protein
MRNRWVLFTCLLIWATWNAGCATPPAAPKVSQVTVEEQAVLPPDVMTDIHVTGRDVHLIFNLSDSTWRTYTAFEITDPYRVIVDLPNTTADGIPPSWTVESGLINKIETVTVHLQPQPYTRVVIELTRGISYTIERVEEEILVTFDQGSESPAISSILAKATTEPPKVELSRETPPTQPQASGEETLPSAGRLLNIQASAPGREESFAIVADGRLDQYRVFTLTDPPRVVVDLRGVQSTDVKDALTPGGSLVKRVRIALHPDKVRLVFDLLRGVGVTYQAMSEGDTLQVRFKPRS